MDDITLMRATETWQLAGVYYVRIEGMAKKHHITLPQDFDEHDTPDTKYVLALDDDFPIATARMYALDDKSMLIGRIVVLPEYRRRGIGSQVVGACEAWAKDLGYESCVLDARDNKVAFYEKIGYSKCGEPFVEGEVFRCIRMVKPL